MKRISKHKRGGFFAILVPVMILAFILSFTTEISPSAFAENTGVLTYTIDGNAATITGCATGAENADVAYALKMITSGAGTSAVNGLQLDENGNLYFAIDGSGAPFEARIDIPLAEYEDMYFDGDLWTLGADYETREGSTILVITAEKLSGFAYGIHEISARFTEDRTVAFTFDLRGAQVPATAESGGTPIPAESPASTPEAPVSGSPILPFLMFIFGAALLLSSTFTLRARRRAAPRT
jgi:hypothetical protein